MLGERESKCSLTCEGAYLPYGRPCVHGCHKILTNWRLAEAAAAREVLHALGYPHISERVSPRGTRCAHLLMRQHGSQTSYRKKISFPGDLRDYTGDLRDRDSGGYSYNPPVFYLYGTRRDVAFMLGGRTERGLSPCASRCAHLRAATKNASSHRWVRPGFYF